MRTAGHIARWRKSRGSTGCLMLLGTAHPDKGITEIWHRPGFDIDEDALPLGVEIISSAALDLLHPERFRASVDPPEES